MAYTSGSSTFNLDLSELIEEAYERAGLQMRSGYDMRTARRSLNLLTIEWANRGINLWTIEQGQITVNVGQAIYALPTDTIDLLDHVVRTGTNQNQQDINITRISESTYSTIPTKNAQGRPIQVWVDRQTGQANTTSVTLVGSTTSSATTLVLSSTASLATTGFIQIDSEIISYQNVSGNVLLNCFRGQANTTAASHNDGAAITVQKLPNINIWPTGDGAGPYTFIYWRLRRLQDSGTGVNIEDIPFRLIPCLVAGIAYMVAVKKPEVDPQRVMGLKAEYEQQWLLASQEDREKASDRFVPRQLFY
jgi:hypothetical protein